jgi:hypothetical protein
LFLLLSILFFALIDLSVVIKAHISSLNNKLKKKMGLESSGSYILVIIFIASAWLICNTCQIVTRYTYYIYWLTNIHSLNAEEKNNLYQYISVFKVVKQN